MAEARKIVGWFYRNGRRIPIFEKKSKSNNIRSDRGNVTDLDIATEAERGVRLESSVAQEMRDHNRARQINGDRVELYGRKPLYKKESATFNMYSDGEKELINFRREPWPEGLRRNAKAMGKTRVANQSAESRFRDEARSNTIKNIAKIDADLSNGTVPDRAKALDKRNRLEDSLKSDFYKKRNSENIEDVKRRHAERQARMKSAERSESETAFTDSRGERQWAKNVDRLPEKTNRFSNGYAKVGSTKTHDIYSDRDSTKGEYYAVEKNNKSTLKPKRGKTTRYEAVETANMAGKAYKNPKPLEGQKFGQERHEASGLANRKRLRDVELFGVRGNYEVREKKLRRAKPAESYIKRIMEERGLNRTDAVKYIMEQRKK